VANLYYGWKMGGRDIRYDFVFGAKRNGDLERVGGWIAEVG
jgi:hypothetical protein